MGHGTFETDAKGRRTRVVSIVSDVARCLMADFVEGRETEVDVVVMDGSLS